MGTIENPGAYEKAIENRIKANANKTRRKTWFATHADAERLSDWLYHRGEFQDHPLTRGMFNGDFGDVLLKMRDAFDEWGGLTDKQTDLVRRALARAEERLVKAQQRREERITAEREGSRHVGAIGERREFTLTVNKVFSFESIYGMTYINICKDVDGNVIVYKGTNSFEEGETVRVKATVKAHEERDGVAQTLIARPKVME